jgi:diguanylate cyclase (GGDEF)-like protein/PAS domain S-box-containing protein
MQGYQWSLYALPAVITAGAAAACAIVTARQRFSRTSAIILASAAAVTAWQSASALMYMAAGTRAALFWARCGCAAALFLGPAIHQFFGSFAEGGRRRKIVTAGAWVVAALFAVLTLTTEGIVSDVREFAWGFYPRLSPGGRLLYPLFFAVFLGAALVDTGRASSRLQGAELQRFRLFASALGVACIASIDLLPMYGVAIYPFGWAALLASTVTVTYAVIKLGSADLGPAVAANEIIGTMRDLLLVSDGDGRIRFANNAACSFLGYPREEILGRPLADFLVPSGPAEPGPLQGWIRDREYIFRTKMGQPIELTLSHSPVTRGGEVEGSIIIGRDLRERKRYEWEARRAVTLLQSTLDSTADGILVLAQDRRVVTWNQRFADLWGIPAGLMEHEDDHDLIGHLADQLVNPAEFLRGLEVLREHPEVHMLELKDGRRLEQYSIGRYLDDQLLRVSSFRDMTARLTAEEALRDSEARYRLLFEQNAAGVCLASVSGRIISSNATFAAMVGHEAEELAGRDLGEVLDRASALEEIQRRLDETPTVRGLEIELRRRDGARVSALANVSLLGRGERALLHMTAVDISDRKRAEQQIEFQAYHDALTQLPNRRLFVERLELSLLSAKRSRGNVGVLFLDLDRFKTINDTLGHSVADALLVEIAQRLRSCVRQTDTVARYGGDEFTIILPDLFQPEDAAQVAEKILERVAEPVVAGATAIEVSVSIGIAVYPHDGTDIDTLLRNADDAMYRAKQAGRNTYQLCTEQMKARANERLSMQSRLRKAMSAGELVLAYQPQMAIASGLIVGAEATIQWNDPERGAIAPRDFIPIAEETRLIVPLSEWALFAACRQLRRWHDAGLPPVRMALNVASRHFQQRDLAAVVRRAIDDTGIDAARLEIEIRETTAMRDVELSVELLHNLRDTGVSVAINDFGSAYSALGSLRLLPINAVKMDRLLIENVAAAEGDAIVAAVIGVSRSLGLRVTADGVETREQFEFLESRGCDEAEGSFCGRPVDPESFERLFPSRLTGKSVE